MAWGRSPGEELAAQRAADLAVEQAARRGLMSPFEQQLLEVLGEIRDALTRPAATTTDPPGGSGQLAGGDPAPAAPAGEHQHLWIPGGDVTGPPCSCGREALPVYLSTDPPRCLPTDPVTAWVHRDNQTPACTGAFTTDATTTP